MLSAIYPIVEGRGDVLAVPVLLRRFAHSIFENYGVYVFPAYRLPRGRMVAGTYLERAVELGGRKLRQRTGHGAIVVLLDADDDCPAELGPALFARVRNARRDIPASVVLAKSEYETWFLSAAESLRGARGILGDAVPPDDPENIRNAKEYLERTLMTGGSAYSPTVDQPALTAEFDFNQARACLSFDKLWRDLDRLFAT